MKQSFVTTDWPLRAQRRGLPPLTLILQFHDLDLVHRGALLRDQLGQGDAAQIIDHLAGKFSWVEALPDDDHTARLRLRDVDALPERLDEVVAEIGMSRALLEG